MRNALSLAVGAQSSLNFRLEDCRRRVFSGVRLVHADAPQHAPAAG